MQAAPELRFARASELSAGDNRAVTKGAGWSMAKGAYFGGDDAVLRIVR
jgi:hypothetical protein